MNVQTQTPTAATCSTTRSAPTASSSSSSPRPSRSGWRPVRADGLHRRRQAPLQERAALPPGRHQLHPQHGAGRPGRRLPPRARPLGQRHGLPREATPPRPSSWPSSAARRRCQGTVGPMELNIPAIEGIGGSNLYLVDRYGAQEIYDVDFEPIQGAAEAAAANEQRRPDLPRPPDPQRAPRQHGEVGRLLRAHLQLPRDPLLRHRGQADRPVLQGHDQPGRQDPHPAEREPGRALADRGVPASDYKGEGIQHIALGTDDIFAHGRGDARAAA